MSDDFDYAKMTAEIVSAYVSSSTVAAGELPSLIQQVHRALQAVGSGTPGQIAPPPKPPAVSIRKSITPEYLTCLEDGRKFKSLKRHLRTQYDLSPEQYRAKWGLPADYPMVAPNSSAARSAMAKQMGFGQGGRGGAPKGRGRVKSST